LEQLQRQITEIQLSALREAEKVLQHKINNPLAVIALSLSRLKRAVQRDRELIDEANDIECASQRIGSVLTDFSRTQLR
jgi:nitrogen fixation/metabolism regulation signal transduction histidine kinase